MTKKIKKLEQETASWKSKWEGCDKSLQNVLKQVRTFSRSYITYFRNWFFKYLFVKERRARRKV